MHFAVKRRLEGLQNLWTSDSPDSVSGSDFFTLGHKLPMHHAERMDSHLKTHRKQKLLWMHRSAVAFNLCLLLASLQAPALVVVRSWSPFCSSCLIWGSAFSMWWQGDPDSQGCPRNAMLALLSQSLVSTSQQDNVIFFACSWVHLPAVV